MKKPALEKYDSNEFNKLTDYYKNQFTEDYQSLSDRTAKINLHSNFISISESLQETESLYRKKGKQELNNLIGSIACCLWKDDDYLNEVAGIFDEFSYDTHMAPGVEADTERKEIFNKILEASARVFISFCNIHGFHEDLEALKDIIKNHKELFISSYEYYFPEIEDDYSVFFHLEKLYKENFKVVARLYPTWGLVDIINLNGYDYEIKEQDFKERDSIREKNDFAIHLEQLAKDNEPDKNKVIKKAKEIVNGKSRKEYVTPSGNAQRWLWMNPLLKQIYNKPYTIKNWLNGAIENGDL